MLGTESTELLSDPALPGAISGTSSFAKEPAGPVREDDDAILKYHAERIAFDVLQKVVDTTTELFGADVRIKSDYDPEFPDDKYTVFCVDVAGTTDSILQLENEWCRRVNQLVQGVDSFRLSIRRKP